MGEQPFATAAEVGSIWGLAYRKQRGHLFAAATLRRHAGTGPRGLGGIYVLNPQAGSATVGAAGNVLDSWSVVDQLGVAVAAGAPFLGDGATSNTARGLPGNRVDPSYDVAAFDGIGKVGIGDIDLTPDGNTLFFVNHYDRSLYSIDISGYDPTNPATRPTAASLLSKPTTGACTGGEWRPSALKIRDGQAYVGGVCDGSTGTRSDLRAQVWRISISGGNWPTQAWSNVFDFPLTYPKGYPAWELRNFTGALSTRMWQRWTSNFFDIRRNGPSMAYSVPILSDIEFDIDGSIILGFNDRSGFQTGRYNYSTDTNDTYLYIGNVGGDILRGYVAGNVFVLENGGRIGALTGYSTSNNEGPGFGEFYQDNFVCCYSVTGNADPHTETVVGGLAILPGSGEVAATSMDPRSENEVGGAVTNAAGIRYLSNLTGRQNRSFVVYGRSDTASNEVGKATGLGDLELACDVINYLEIGNRIWADLDADGVQDPGEPGIGGVQVALYRNGVQVGAPVTTTAEGRYLFNTGLLPNTAYEIRVNRAQMVPLGYVALTAANAGQGVALNADLRDSDAVMTGMEGVIAVTTGAYGEVNHTLDMGWQRPYSLGNRVWMDLNNNGAIDAGDGLAPGVDGVALRLLNAGSLTQATDAAGMLVADQTTAAGGYYRFDNLLAGDYVVEILPSNFTGTGRLIGWTSSGVDEANPNADGDSNDNGLGGLGVPPNALTGIRSGTVTLGPGVGTESITDNDPGTNPLPGEAANGESNRTVDFGFVPVLYSLGNRVWKDLNDNGLIDSLDGVAPGVNGVRVRLFDVRTGQPATDARGLVVADQLTSGGGYYRFDNLLAGDYVVEVSAANFTSSGPLDGWNSSSTDEVDPGSDLDGNDNGLGIFPGPVTGVRSGAVRLGPGTGSEPLNDNDPLINPLTGEAGNGESNRTVDFGFVPAEATARLTGPGRQIPPPSVIKDTKPGSLLIFPIYTSDPTNPSRQDTRLSLTNSSESRSICVHMFFIDGSSCAVTNTYTCLTPNQTTSFQAVDLDPGVTGYAVMVAVDEAGCPVSFNNIIGDEYLKLNSGHKANLAAESFSALYTGTLPGCDSAATAATLNLDGLQYNMSARVLAASAIASPGDGHQSLLVLTRTGGDLRVGATTFGNLVGVIYNDVETSASFTIPGGECLIQRPLSNSFPRTTPRLSQLIPAGRTGWLKVWGEGSGGMIGALLTMNSGTAGTIGAFTGGRNLHVLTETTDSYVVPVFPMSR